MKNWSEEFLRNGMAVSQQQADHMAEILDSQELSPDSTMILLWIGQKTGAAFDPALVTDAEIDKACIELNAMQALDEALEGQAGSA